MNSINYKGKNEMTIKYKKINPFYNICKVTGIKEECNIEIEYIPNDKVIEIGSYRETFTKVFNEYIEDLAQISFELIWNTIVPKYLKVIVYLEDDKLTPWNVTIEKWQK